MSGRMMAGRGRTITRYTVSKLMCAPDHPAALHMTILHCSAHDQDDILCVAYCPPRYLATGSFDGEVKVWNLDTEKVVSQFQSITKLRPSMM